MATKPVLHSDLGHVWTSVSTLKKIALSSHIIGRRRDQYTCEEGMGMLAVGRCFPRSAEAKSFIHSYGGNLLCEFLSYATNKVQETAPERTGRHHCGLEHECG